jgi:hypothetical protein
MRNRHLLFNSGSNEVRLVVETQYRAAWQVGHLVRRYAAAENGQSSAQSFDVRCVAENLPLTGRHNAGDPWT